MHRTLAAALFLVSAFYEAYAADYAVGADLSFLKQAEDRGTVFKDNNQPKPGLQIFKDHGYNWIRLRLPRARAVGGGRLQLHARQHCGVSRGGRAPGYGADRK